MTEVLDRVRAGEPDPACTRCGGVLKSATIFFGESLVEADLERSIAAAESCDVLVCVGTTLQVYPIAHMVPVALGAGAEPVIVNAEATPFDDEAAAVVRGSISDVLPVVLGVSDT
jgi:NAD-dependent deacetylase